jgi:O-antigen/teichoic acid export membrane protein
MKNVLYILISSYGAMVLGLVVSLYTKQILGPSFAGALAFVTVVMYYSNAINSVFRSAMDREVPMARGRQDNQLEIKISGHVYWATLIVNILFSVIFIMGAFYYWGDLELRYAFLIGLSLSNIASISSYLQVYCRVYEQFRSSSIYVMSIQMILQLSSLIGVISGGLVGYVYASTFSFIATIFIAKQQILSVARVNFDKNIIKIILRSGILLSVFAFVQLGLFTIDRFFILQFLTRIDLGNYAIALTISSVLSMLPTSLSSSLLMPKWYKWASANEWEKANASIIAASFVALMATSIAILLSAIYIIPFLIQTFMSKFILAIESAQILCVSAYWFFMIGPFSVLLSAKQKYWQMIYCGVIGITTAAVMDYYMVGWGIAGIAKSTTVALFIFANLIFIISQRSLKVGKWIILQDFILLNSFGVISFLFLATNLFFVKYLYLTYLIYLIIYRRKIQFIVKEYLGNVGISNYEKLLYGLYSKWQ